MESNIYTRWTFIGITYNPYADKVFCAVNEEYAEETYVARTEGPNRKAKLTGAHHFMVDDVVYAPVKFDKIRMAILYNQSEYDFPSDLTPRNSEMVDWSVLVTNDNNIDFNFFSENIFSEI